MGIKFIIFLGVLSLFYSCSSKKEQVESQVEERVLSAESLSINKDFLAKPEKIYCYDSLLFVWDSHNGQLCSLFNYLTGQYYGRFATLGNGPSEFALGTIGYPNQGKFYLSNYITGHIAQYDIQALSNDINHKPTTLFRQVFSDKAFLSSIIPIHDSLFLGAGVYDLKDQYLLFNKRNQIVDSNIPIYNKYDQSERAYKLLANQGFLTKAPTSNRFAFALKYSQNVDFFEIIDNKIQVINLSRKRNPNFRFLQNGNSRMIYPTENSTLGFLDITSGDQNVYVLYSEKNIKDVKSSNIVHVYDWKGSLIKQFRLSEEVYSISVNKHENILLASFIDKEGDWNILSYKLDNK